MMALQPNDPYRARFPLPNLKTPAGIYRPRRPSVTPPGTSSPGMCACATPRIRDPKTGEWLHLETMRRCPKRPPDGA
jgi:hypothetical protein